MAEDTVMIHRDPPAEILKAIADVVVSSWPAPKRLGLEDARKVWQAVVEHGAVPTPGSDDEATGGA